MLVALVPLTLLGLGLLAELGLRDVWDDTIGPSIRDRVTSPVYTGVDFTVDGIFASSSAGLVAFAAALLLWHLSRAVRTVMKALNRIFDQEERRSARRILLVDAALTLGLGACVVAAILAVAVLPRFADGPLGVGAAVLAWVVAAAFLYAALRLLVRYGSCENVGPAQATVGSAVVIAGWVLASIGFGWWAGSVADYTTAVGSLTVFLVLTAYVFVVSAVFLAGVQLDALARELED